MILALALAIGLTAGASPAQDDSDVHVGDGDEDFFADGDLTFTEISLADLGIEYKQSVECGVEENGATAFCRDGVWVEDPTLECLDDADPLWPVARRERDGAGAWTPWVVVEWWSCPGEPGSAIEITLRDMERFPIDAPGVTVQPNGGRALIHMPTIYYATDVETRGFSARVIGQVVDLAVRPISYEWDFGDGSGWAGDDPGAPYPDYTVHRTFDTLGTFTATLTTTWSGVYRVDGGAWQDIDGTVQTTSSADPVETVERRTHLLRPE